MEHFWDAVKGLTQDTYKFRNDGSNLNDALYKSWQYVEKLACECLPGGVYITNFTYVRLWNFDSVIVPSTPTTDAWWASCDLYTILFRLGTN